MPFIFNSLIFLLFSVKPGAFPVTMKDSSEQLTHPFLYGWDTEFFMGWTMNSRCYSFISNFAMFPRVSYIMGLGSWLAFSLPKATLLPDLLPQGHTEGLNHLFLEPSQDMWGLLSRFPGGPCPAAPSLHQAPHLCQPLALLPSHRATCAGLELAGGAAPLAPVTGRRRNNLNIFPSR